jgi:plastocyanin
MMIDKPVKFQAALLSLLAIIMASGCGSASASEISKVRIESFEFTPAVITVKAGTTITFVNNDEVPHSVVGLRAGDEVFRSDEQISQGESFSVVAELPGEIVLNCGLHSKMSGKIIVLP